MQFCLEIPGTIQVVFIYRYFHERNFLGFPFWEWEVGMFINAKQLLGILFRVFPTYGSASSRDSITWKCKI